jgi:thioredoxin-related protein
MGADFTDYADSLLSPRFQPWELVSRGIDYLCNKSIIRNPNLMKFFKPIYTGTLMAIFFLLSALMSPALAQKGNKPAPIKWVTLEQAAALSEKEPRKILIDVYTDWCGWCKQMDKRTFTDPGVAAYVNQKFYAVKLNAEGREPITINGKIYRYNEQARAHEAALALLSGKMSYPTTVYLDEHLGIITPVPGYLEAPMMKTILTYFGDNHYKQKTFDEYTAAAKIK